MPYLKCPLHTVLKLTPVAYGKWDLSAKHAKAFDLYVLLNPRCPWEKSRGLGWHPGLVGFADGRSVSLCSLLQAAGWSPSR